MTEYDFSPAAYERAAATQNRIARWVDETKRHDPANPFVPIPGEHGSVYAPTSPPPTIPDRTPPPQPSAQLPQQYYSYQPQQPTPGYYTPPQAVVSPTYVTAHKRHKSKRHHSKHGSRSLNPSPNNPPSIALPAAVIPIGNGMYATAAQTQLAQPMQPAASMMSPPQQQPPQAYNYGSSPYSGLQQMQAQSMAHAQARPYQYSVGYTSPLNSPPIQPVMYSPKGSKPRSIKSPKSSIYASSVVSPPATTVSYVQPAPSNMGVGGGFVFVGNGAPPQNYIYGPPQPRSSSSNASDKESQSFFGAFGLGSSKKSKKSPTHVR
ncbi:hypothetical protein CPB83DRAFT_422709 [Crepidotus variabilis]|uniref:Uncharacterized protein n=1 Tax=Crepidotus variabilis TaxID=179855 RepID=A0A9P6JVN3_9AGAR|nr:hypothetical protein CPB83DRAFT_422709 [Crepidotus variabilis]